MRAPGRRAAPLIKVVWGAAAGFGNVHMRSCALTPRLASESVPAPRCEAASIQPYTFSGFGQAHKFPPVLINSRVTHEQPLIVPGAKSVLGLLPTSTHSVSHGYLR